MVLFTDKNLKSKVEKTLNILLQDDIGGTYYTTKEHLLNFNYENAKDAAAGNGVADDSPALNLVQTAGITIYPNGTYNVEKNDGLAGKEPCVQQVSSSRQIGICKNTSIIEAVSGDQPTFGIINDNDATGQLKNIEYENLTIKGNSASPYSDCIHIQYTDGYKVENCNIENAGRDGIYIGSPYQAYNPPKCNNGIIRDNICTNNVRWDISLLHGDNLHIDNNYFESGVDIEPTTSTAENSNIRVINNTFNGGALQFYNTKRNNDGSVLALTGSITAGLNTLTVSDSTHLEVGQFIGIDGTGPDYFHITAIDGNTVTLHTNAVTTVTNANIRTFLQLRDITAFNNLIKDVSNIEYGTIRAFLTTHINLAYNNIYNCDGDGMSLDRVTLSNICNNRIIRDESSNYYGEDYGIYLTRSQNKVIGNIISGYNTGIRCSRGIGADSGYQPYQTADNDLQNIISENHIKVDGNIGIWMQTQSDKSSIVTNNIIQRTNLSPNNDTNSAGIYVKSVGTVIRNNHIKGNFYYGIRLYAESEDCIIEDNNINGCVSSYITDAGVHNKINGYYYSAAIPTEGSWVEGDMIKQSVYFGNPTWACQQSGTCGTLNSGATTGSINLGSNVLTLSTIDGLRPLRNFITIAGVTSSFEIIKLEGNTAYLNKTADATVVDASVNFKNPVFG